MIQMTTAQLDDAFSHMGYDVQARSRMIETLQRWQAVYDIPNKPQTSSVPPGWTNGTQSKWEFGTGAVHRGSVPKETRGRGKRR